MGLTLRFYRKMSRTRAHAHLSAAAVAAAMSRHAYGAHGFDLVPSIRLQHTFCAAAPKEPCRKHSMYSSGLVARHSGEKFERK
jgi:hypothetical protein